MNFRKFNLPTLFTLLFSVLLITSCEDYNDLELQDPGGEADFSSVVAVGNSLTAGLQSNALYENGQRYSYPALVAGQIETVQDFEQPLISDPGIGGRVGLDEETLSNPVATEEQGTPLNDDLDRPYNNLGIPSAILADFLGQDLPGNDYTDRRDNNPFFDIILRDYEAFGATQAEQMATLNATFVLFGLGNNDVLGYVSSGGNTPYVPAANFEQLYAASMQTISDAGANAVVYNITDVTSLPFVFLTNSQLIDQGTMTVNQAGSYALATEQGNVPLWIEITDPATPGAVVDTVQMRAPNIAASQPGAFFILPAGSQLPELFGNGVGTTPANPIPHHLVLDNGEMRQAMALVRQYNQVIEAQAASNGFAVVDMFGTFAEIIQTYQNEGTGYEANGLELAPIPGELFSFDGVHPTNRGQGVIANATIEAINNTYNTNIETIDISTIPQGIPVNN